MNETIYNIGDKIYIIEKKKVVELEVASKVTTETKGGLEVDYFAEKKSWVMNTIVLDVDNLSEVFPDKESAKKVVEIVKRYT